MDFNVTFEALYILSPEIKEAVTTLVDEYLAKKSFPKPKIEIKDNVAYLTFE